MSAVGVEEAARQGAATIGWDRRNTISNSNGAARKRGIGMAMVIHSCGSNPSGSSEARVEIDDGGALSLFPAHRIRAPNNRRRCAKWSPRCCGYRSIPSAATMPIRPIVLSIPVPTLAARFTARELPPRGPLEAMKQTLFELAAEKLEAPQDQLVLADGFVTVIWHPVAQGQFRRAGRRQRRLAENQLSLQF